jgi:hypothetical protein
VKAGQLRISALLRLPVLDADGVRMAIVDVRTSQPTPPDAPHVLGLLCSPDPVFASLGLKRSDLAASPARRRAHTHGRFVAWHEIGSIGADGVRLRCRLSDLPLLSETPDPGPPAPSPAQE